MQISTQALTNQGNAHWVKHEKQVMQQQAASSSSGGSEPVRCRGSCGGARTSVEVRGRQRAQAVGPPAVGGVDAREGVRTPESSGTVAARRGREHERRSARAPRPREGEEQARGTSR